MFLLFVHEGKIQKEATLEQGSLRKTNSNWSSHMWLEKLMWLLDL